MRWHTRLPGAVILRTSSCTRCRHETLGDLLRSPMTRQSLSHPSIDRDADRKVVASMVEVAVRGQALAKPTCQPHKRIPDPSRENTLQHLLRKTPYIILAPSNRTILSHQPCSWALVPILEPEENVG